MTEYSNENRLQIWGNQKKAKSTDPDHTGSLNINGVEYWLSAWKRKEGASSKSPALSGSIKPKNEQPQSISQRAMPKRDDRISTGRQGYDDMDGDSIPF